MKGSVPGGAGLQAGGIQRIWGGGDDATRGCEHVDSELLLSLVRGKVASTASPSATQNPRPSHGFAV